MSHVAGIPIDENSLHELLRRDEVLFPSAFDYNLAKQSVFEAKHALQDLENAIVRDKDAASNLRTQEQVRSVLQCVAVCCSVLQYAAVCVAVCVAVCCSVQFDAACCRVLQHVATYCSASLVKGQLIRKTRTNCIKKCYNMLQHTARHCNINTLQHTTVQSVSCSKETHVKRNTHMCDMTHVYV